jgi:uncharacterized protein HemX
VHAEGTAPPTHADKPLASNDLRPTSGTIEAKRRRSSPVRQAHAPVEVTEEPPPPVRPPTPQPTQIPQLRRTPPSARKKSRERPVRVYVLMGLAIGLGIVLAYWVYWSMPFGHR